MEIMIFCGIYLVELVCYLIVMRMLFDKRVKTKAWMIAVLVSILVRISVTVKRHHGQGSFYKDNS